MESVLAPGFHYVVEDFQKLLLSNADEKTIVFRFHSDEFDRNVTYPEDCIKAYKGGNGTLHFIAFISNERHLKRKEYEVSKQILEPQQNLQFCLTIV